MAISKFTITSSAWVQITSAGKSGSCWLSESAGESCNVADVRVWHGKTPPVMSDKNSGKRLYIPKNSADCMQINADDSSDIYYAIAMESRAPCVLVVDVV